MARSRNGYRKRVTNCASSLDDVKVLNPIDSRVLFHPATQFRDAIREVSQYLVSLNSSRRFVSSPTKKIRRFRLSFHLDGENNCTNALDRMEIPLHPPSLSNEMLFDNENLSMRHKFRLCFLPPSVFSNIFTLFFSKRGCFPLIHFYRVTRYSRIISREIAGTKLGRNAPGASKSTIVVQYIYIYILIEIISR